MNKKRVAFYIHNHENPIRFIGVLKEFEKTGRKDVYRIHDLDEEEKRRDESSTTLLAVWENTPTKAIQAKQIDIYNHLSAASMIFGDKANLGILTQSMKTNTLKNKVFSTGMEFLKWCRGVSEEKTSDEARFVAKIPQANSGAGIWILSQRNRVKLAPEIVRASNGSKVVVQEYVRNPLLRNSRKLQFMKVHTPTKSLKTSIHSLNFRERRKLRKTNY